MSRQKSFTTFLTQDWTRILLVAVGLAVIGLTAILLNTIRAEDGTQARIDTAKKTEIVKLNDGDSYEISTKPVLKQINGKEVELLSYNGQVPGPTIEVTEGDTITINIKNELGIATTIHPHGINADSKNDGVPELSQDEIEAGGEFEQTIEFPEPGVFWYHPHVREDYTQGSGMYANFIVRPKDSAGQAAFDTEQFIMLSDIALNSEGDPDYSKDAVSHVVMGRFGNEQLINGESDFELNLKQNEVTRLYLTNAASARSFKFEIPGASIKLVGGDNGFYEEESLVDHVTIAPSERYVVDVLFEKPGDYSLLNNTPQNTYELGVIRVADSSDFTSAASSFSTLKKNQEVTESINEMIAEAETGVTTKRLATKVDMNPLFMQSMADEMAAIEEREAKEGHSSIEWEDEMPDGNSRSNIDNTQWSLVDLDNPREESIDWEFSEGELVKIVIENSEETMHPMQHPIHIHGQKFVVTSINGEPTENRSFEDVEQIPVGDTYEILVRMENKGTWLFHCHISEHMESGMVGKFSVN